MEDTARLARQGRAKYNTEIEKASAFGRRGWTPDPAPTSGNNGRAISGEYKHF